MDWDAFRFFRVIAQQGSVRGAASELGVNPSTVSRRLENLEAELGVHLFTRSPGGFKITTEGVEVAQRTDHIAHEFRLLEASLKGRDQKLQGHITVVLPTELGQLLLFDELAAFTALYPDIELNLLPESRDPSVLRGEVHVIVRATDAPPETMIGRRLMPLGLAAYGTPELVQLFEDARTSLKWVEGISPNEMHEISGKLREHYFADVRVQLRLDEWPMRQAALRAGLGVGILPCLLGEQDDTLRRLPNMPVQPGPRLWLLTHPEQRSVRRVQVFLEFLREVLMNQIDVILPENAP